MKRLMMLASVVACGFSARAATPVYDWFAATPSNLDGGEWNPPPSGTNTSGTAYWSVDTEDVDDAAVFTAKSIEANGMTTRVSSMLCFSAAMSPAAFPEPTEDTQAGLLVGVDGDGNTNYYGLVAADGTPNCAWQKLQGAFPPVDLQEQVAVKFIVNYGDSPVTVSYQIGDTVLTSDGTTSRLTRRGCTQTKVSSICYSGSSRIESIAGDVDAAAAIGDTNYVSFADAVAVNDGTIKLYHDAAHDFGKTLTCVVDKNGFNFTPSCSAGFSKITTSGDTVTCLVRTSQTFDGGEGTAESPYVISTELGFQEFSYWASHGAETTNKFYKLGADFDLTSLTDVSLPLFSETATTNWFAGTFDGDNHKVRYELEAGTGYDGYGLFGVATNATFRNLVVDGKLSGGESGNLGAIVLGYASGNVTFENVTAQGSVTNQFNAAGIVGFWKPRNAADRLTLTSCTNEAMIVTGYTKAGGMISYTGSNANDGIRLTDCLNKGYVAVNRNLSDEYEEYKAREAYAGGLIAYTTGNAGVTVVNCRNEGEIVSIAPDATKVVSAREFIGYNVSQVALDGENVCRYCETVAPFGIDTNSKFTGMAVAYSNDDTAVWMNLADLLAVSGIAGKNCVTVDGQFFTNAVASSDTKLGKGTMFDVSAAGYDQTKAVAYVGKGLTVRDDGKVAPSVSGSGTEEDPYLIKTQSDFDIIDVGAASRGVYYQLANDIALTGEWTGIGAFDAKDKISDKNVYTNAAFQGNFNGNGYAITGLILQRGDYVGFFGSTYGATIRNVKIALGNETGFGAAENGTEGSKEGDEVGVNYGGGAVCGVAVNTVFENCQTITGSYTNFTATKGLAGIVGFVAGNTTLSNCVNNINVTTANEKAGGLAACVQNLGSYASPGLCTVDGCANYGAISCTTSGKVRTGGLLSYVTYAVNFAGSNAVDSVLTQEGGVGYSVASPNGGTLTVAGDAIFTVPAGYLTVYGNKEVDGLCLATVSGSTATLIRKSDVVSGGSYKVMAAGATITLAALGDSITLDETLTNATVNTSAAGCEVTKKGNVYTVTQNLPAPPVPADTPATEVTNAVNSITGMSEANKAKLNAAVAGSAARYNQFSDWTGNCEGGQAVAVAKDYVVESFLLRSVVAASNYIFTNQPKVEATSFTVTSATDMSVTFKLTDGATPVNMTTVKADLASCIVKGTSVGSVTTPLTEGEITADPSAGTGTVTLTIAPSGFTTEGFIRFLAK